MQFEATQQAPVTPPATVPSPDIGTYATWIDSGTTTSPRSCSAMQPGLSVPGSPFVQFTADSQEYGCAASEAVYVV